MSKSELEFLPSVTHTEKDEYRRIGIEIEFIGPDVVDVVQIVEALVGGEAESISEYEYKISGDSAGEWQVERDQDHLKQMGRDKDASDDEPTLVETVTEGALKIGSELLVPLELISPPLPMPRMPEFQEIVDALSNAGAMGTDENMMYAFGLQFNPELPALDANTITRYLQAFFCLQDWLFEQAAVDTARKITSYAKPFGSDYIAKVIASDYERDLSDLIDDYLADNPTRNRALDMLPLFIHLDKKRVRAVVDDKRVKPRPTFHYRLPNSNIGTEGWSIFNDWNDWLVIEWLANAPEKLENICQSYTEYLDQPFSGIRSDWHEEVSKWLEQNHS